LDITYSIEGEVVSSPVLNRRVAIQKEADKILAEGGTADTESLCDVTHRFANGCYCREILIPKGVKIIGKIHATEHFNTILKGSCLVITTTEEKEIVAPYTWVTKAGEQKAVLATSDTIWQTYHVTDKTDLEEIEKEVIAKDWNDEKLLTSEV